jgi:extradiol dioxygenase family protein
MAKKLDIIHHTAIQVQNIAQAVLWYTERFMCEIEYEDESWAMLKFENTSLALVLGETHPYHFAIVTNNLEPYGNPIPHRDGTASVYIKDTDNNNIEMLSLSDKDHIR